MTSLLTEPVASTLIVVDETDGVTLTEISRATSKPLSTIQRAVDSLVKAGVLVRDAPRGRWRFAATAPRRALRQLAEWRLGAASTARITRATRLGAPPDWRTAPPTILDERIRGAWPIAIERIVSAYQPERVILFGSQARGDADSDSDVDLLVVFREEEIDRHERRVEILSLLQNMPFAKDVLVATTANVARPLIGSALADAIGEGVTVYER